MGLSSEFHVTDRLMYVLDDLLSRENRNICGKPMHRIQSRPVGSAQYTRWGHLVGHSINGVSASVVTTAAMCKRESAIARGVEYGVSERECNESHIIIH
jgi:hypothetical protein